MSRMKSEGAAGAVSFGVVIGVRGKLTERCAGVQLSGATRRVSAQKKRVIPSGAPAVRRRRRGVEGPREFASDVAGGSVMDQSSDFLLKKRRVIPSEVK